jgi:tRNA(fMet)-specific endonuclease VapC
LANVTILPVTADVTRLFSDLKASLRRRGIVKSDVDLLIATTALHHGATLVTDDHALLAGDIPELAIENWL